MIKFKVRKRTVQNKLLGCKIILTVVDVCEIIQEVNGSNVLNFYQVYNVNEYYGV